MIFRRVMYFIMFYAIMTYSVLYRTYDGFIMLVFFAAVSLISFIMLVLGRITLRCSFEQSTLYVQRGQQYTIRYRLKNVMPFPITRVGILFDDVKKPQAFTVGAANTAIVTRTDVKEHCGCYFTGVKKICVYDFFRVLGFCIKTPGVAKIVSLPRLFDVNTDKYVESMLFAENDSDKIAIKGSEVREVREYRDGDSLKNIHHKLSSRMSKLMVKEYVAEDENDDIFFFCENDAVNPKTRDDMLEFMYNVMYLRLHKKGMVTGVLGAGNAVLMNITSKDMLDEYFGRMYEENKFGEGDYTDIPSGTFVFAAALSESLYNMCLGLKGRKKDIVLYLPESERSKSENLDVEVVYVLTGGEGN